MIVRLTHGDSQVRLNLSFDKRLPRVRANPGTVNYNASSSPVLRGSSDESKFLWTLTAKADRSQYASLQLIYGLSDLARRNLDDPAIILEDLTEPIVEPVRTRAIADGTNELSIPGGVSYYAKFEVFFAKPPEAVEIADGYQTNFVLVELDRVAP